MALFVPGFVGSDHVEQMVSAAEGLLRGVAHDSSESSPGPSLGVGLAFVGNVGSGEVKDFTAIGDVVNTAARLRGEAKPGQMVIEEGERPRAGGGPSDRPAPLPFCLRYAHPYAPG